jgi:hypothetical protein
MERITKNEVLVYNKLISYCCDFILILNNYRRLRVSTRIVNAAKQLCV